MKLSGPSPQPSPQRGEGDELRASDVELPRPFGERGGRVDLSIGSAPFPRPSGERDAGRQGEGAAPAKTTIARRLRRDSTEAENQLWTRLRNRQLAGWKFVRQFPVAGFYADFACREAMLIIEVDGSQHADSEHDKRRSAVLRAQGYDVLRFWNNDVLKEPDSILTAILDVLEMKTRPVSMPRSVATAGR